MADQNVAEKGVISWSHGASLLFLAPFFPAFSLHQRASRIPLDSQKCRDPFFIKSYWAIEKNLSSLFLREVVPDWALPRCCSELVGTDDSSVAEESCLLRDSVELGCTLQNCLHVAEYL